MKKLILVLALVLGLAVNGSAQIAIPKLFINFTRLFAADMNGNFTALAAAVNRNTGGTITGNISASNGITIDGADVSTYLANGKLRALSAAADSVRLGGGIQAAGNLIVGVSGRIPTISSTYFASLDGSTLTNLVGAELTGTISSATQDNITRTGTITSGTWSALFGAVSAAPLTTLNAANFTTGLVPPLRLSSFNTPTNLTLLRGDGIWTELAGTAIPTDMVVFSNSGACPAGFVEYTNARGFAIVGLPAGGTSQGTVGTGFTNMENRSHTHVVSSVVVNAWTNFNTQSNPSSHSHTGTTSGPSATVGQDSLFAEIGAATSTHTHTFTTSVDSMPSHTPGSVTPGATNAGTSGAALTSDVMAYVQAIACRKT